MKSKFSESVFVVWQVQRKSKKGEWVNAGRFETRSRARERNAELRDGRRTDYGYFGIVRRGLGFGNTRVLRVVIAKPCRPSPPMMTSPRAPGSYADTRTIHARTKP